MIACLIEEKMFDKAMTLIENVVSVFNSEHVDLKVCARILQRKGTIHLKRDEFKLAVESFEISLNKNKSDAVIDLLNEAKNKLFQHNKALTTQPQFTIATNKGLIELINKSTQASSNSYDSLQEEYGLLYKKFTNLIIADKKLIIQIEQLKKQHSEHIDKEREEYRRETKLET